MLQERALRQDLHQGSASPGELDLDDAVFRSVPLQRPLPGRLLQPSCAFGAFLIGNAAQNVFCGCQFSVFDLPELSVHLPIQRTALGHGIPRRRVGDDGGIQRQIRRAPVHRSLFGAHRLTDGNADRMMPQQRILGKVDAVAGLQKQLHAAAAQGGGCIQRPELQMTVIFIGDKEADDLALQRAGIVLFLCCIVSGNGLGAVDLGLGQIAPHCPIDRCPVEQGVRIFKTGLNAGCHQPQVELRRLQGIGADILIGEDEQCRPHGQRGQRGKDPHTPHDLPPQRETVVGCLHEVFSLRIGFST